MASPKARGSLARYVPIILFELLLSLRVYAEGVPIAPSPIGRAPGSSGPSSTAVVGDRFITIWSYRPGLTGNHIYASIHDAEGRRVSPQALPVVSNTRSSA